MEAVHSDLLQQGIGAEVKHTPITTKEEQDRLWAAKELGTDTPKQLQSSIMFERYFVSMGVLSSEDERFLSFKGDMVQTIMFMLKMAPILKVQNKVVLVYMNTDNPSRCVVVLLDMYLSKLPLLPMRKTFFT